MFNAPSNLHNSVSVAVWVYVIFVGAVYFLGVDGVVAMATTFLEQGLAGTAWSERRVALLRLNKKKVLTIKCIIKTHTSLFKHYKLTGKTAC